MRIESGPDSNQKLEKSIYKYHLCFGTMSGCHFTQLWEAWPVAELLSRRTQGCGPRSPVSGPAHPSAAIPTSSPLMDAFAPSACSPILYSTLPHSAVSSFSWWFSGSSKAGVVSDSSRRPISGLTLPVVCTYSEPG